jgi:hypothetical protein
MCKHRAYSVVAVDAVPIAQCDVCGALLPGVEVDEDAIPNLGMDAQALDFACQQAMTWGRRESARLDSLTPGELAAETRAAWLEAQA